MKLENDSLLLDESPDAVIATTLEGAVIYWSRGAENIFGFTAGEALGRYLKDLVIPPDLVAEEARQLEVAVHVGASTREAYRHCKDGSVVHVDVTCKAVRNERGEVRFILSNQKDVTQLKVQRDAKLLAARFGHILESTPDGIVMVNSSGRIVLANSQAERLFGYERGELLGKTIEHLIPERFRQGHVGHRLAYIGHPHQRAMGAGLELYGLRKDGSEFPVEISLSPLETEEGTLVSSAIRDITDRKRFECELQQKNHELEAANQELEAFSYSVSHDLRAPIRAMGGFAQMLMCENSDQLSPEAQHALQRIRKNAFQMGELIDGLLNFSSLSRQSLSKARIELTPLAQAVWEELRPEWEGRAVELTCADLPAVQGDAVLLRQVLANLLSNAVKYTRDRAPAVITVGCRPETPVVYFIRDNGAGFDMQYAEKLFRVFQRLHSGEEFQGTGVGLAIVKRIIQRHGGRIWAEAREGRGATFYFTLEGGGRHDA
jgi:PAS domain S-box-containing protein